VLCCGFRENCCVVTFGGRLALTGHRRLKYSSMFVLGLTFLPRDALQGKARYCDRILFFGQ